MNSKQITLDFTRLDPAEKIKAIADKALARMGELQHEEQAEVPEAQVIPFPTVWPDISRAAPSCVLRSALFGVVQRGRRRYLERQELAAWKDVTIRYTGMRLDQADLDVWMQAVHLFRHCGLGERLNVSAYALLKAIGRHTGKGDHEWLTSSLARLIACAVEIRVNKKLYAGNLVREFWLDQETGHYVLSINPQLASLFADGYSQMEWEQRQALGARDLAKWLLGYISTHQATGANPHRIGLDKLQQLCGSEMDAKEFKRQTRRYLDELKGLEVIDSWRFTGADSHTVEFIKPSVKPELQTAEVTG